MISDKTTIKDTLQRPVKDLRISVTDRCNFRCHYCMPEEIYGHKYEFLSRENILTFEEITRVARLFVRLGVTKLRLTGGEPLLRHELHKLIGKLAAIEGITDLALTTNGYLLRKYGELLREAGLRRVTISLDTLNADLFPKMAGKHLHLEHVLSGIAFARELGFSPIKINSVIQKGVNDAEILPLLEFALDRGFIIRFIEYMDVGNVNDWRRDEVVSAREIVEVIKQHYDLEPLDSNYPGEVASRFRITGNGGEFGVIASVTQPFCQSCTRARLSADGKLFTCLFGAEGKDIKALLRSGESDEHVLQFLSTIWRQRADRYSEERVKLQERKKNKKVEMYHIGG